MGSIFRHSKRKVYVIHTTQQDLFCILKKELWNRILVNDKFKRVPHTNEQDLPEALNITGIKDKLDIKLILDHSIAIFPSLATKYFKVFEGME